MVEAKTTFNQVAEEYHSYRPHYPKALFQDIIEYSEITPEAEILEIGCGTGQATQVFVNEGYRHITCIELGENLAKITRKKFKHETLIHVHHSSFEEWEGKPSHYDLAISATAFHFIEPHFGYRKAAHLLKENGTMAFFWTIHVPSYKDIFMEIREVYKTYAPHLNDAVLPAPAEEIENRIKIMESTEILTDIAVKQYEWQETYTSDHYVSLLNTHSGHQLLSVDTREKLLGEIKQIIDAHGGRIEKHHMAALFLARLYS